MRKIFLLVVILCGVSLAKPTYRTLTYYSMGEPLQYALDYAFGSFGYRFAAAPEILAYSWWGQLNGRVSSDELPRYLSSVLRPMGLTLSLDENGVFQVVQNDLMFSDVRDTLLVLDTAAIAGLSAWCAAPNCFYALMPSPGAVMLRYRPGFAGFISKVSEAAAPLAVEDVPPLQVHMIIYRHNADTTRTIGLDWPARYLPVPDLLHRIDLYEESGEIDITARPSLNVRPGGRYELFFGSERPYQRSTLQESGAVTIDQEYRKYGLSLSLDYQAAKNGRYSFALSLSSSSYNEDGTNVLSETKTDIELPLDSALVVASIDAVSLVQRRRGLPYLVEIPVIGRLFGRVVDVAERSRYDVLFWVNSGVDGRPDSTYTFQAEKR